MLSSGWDLTVEYNLDEIDKGVFYQDLGLERTGTLADGRGTYDGANDFWLTNDDQGETKRLRFLLIKTSMDLSSWQLIQTLMLQMSTV